MSFCENNLSSVVVVVSTASVVTLAANLHRLRERWTGVEMHNGWITTLVEGGEMQRARLYTDPAVSKSKARW